MSEKHTSINETPTGKPMSQKIKSGCISFIKALKPAPCPWSAGGYVKLAIVLILVGALVAVVIFNKEIGNFLGKDGALAKFVAEIGIWGPIVFGAVYAACTVFFVPGTILTLASGVVFPQLWVAFLSVSFGSTIGACLAFLLGRSVLRSWVDEKVAQFPTFQAVDVAIGQKGFIMIFLLRLSPVIPFNLLNYASGITTVKFIPYAFASWIGMAPGTFLYIYIVWAVANAARTGGSGNTSSAELAQKILLYGVGPVVTLAAVIFVTWVAKREVGKAMKNAEKEKLLPE